MRSSNLEDIFYQCDTKNSIELIITFTKNDFTEAISPLEIGFSLKTSGMNYVIELINYNDYDFKKFNEFFNNFPEPVNASFASPIPAIRDYEKFVTRPQKQEIDISSRFKGIYPSATNPIISSLGSSNGLDFINAMEANRIIFVEGQDDAKVINLLLQHRIPKNTNKYVF